MFTKRQHSLLIKIVKSYNIESRRGEANEQYAKYKNKKEEKEKHCTIIYASSRTHCHAD